MKVLIIGKNGQLAWELQRSVPSDIQLSVAGSQDADISQIDEVRKIVRDCAPDVIVNCAAYTAVDKAESEPEKAFAVNALGAQNLAELCKEYSIRLIHVSTDFVFDGTQSTPYLPSDQTLPLGVYGESKRQGEVAIESLLGNQAVVVRTSWVYSSHGANFVKTMLRLMKDKSQLNVVADQIGTPTWAKGLADWIWRVVAKPTVGGIYHWTDAGVASWYDFSVAISELAVQKGLLAKPISVRPIPASDYPTPAKRPSFSVLDKTMAENAAETKTLHWRAQLSLMLDELCP